MKSAPFKKILIAKFLLSVDNGNWDASKYGGYWLAAAGRFCNLNSRYVLGLPYATGCMEANGVPGNDGVVCADSAQYSYYSTPGPAGKPTAVFNDPNTKYSHTDTLAGYGTWLMFGCAASTSTNPQMFDPKPGEDPFGQMVQVINNGH